MIGSSFIQHEQLSERIKDILTQYPDGFALPKEMVQNADDAGATKVHFIWDNRSHPTHYLLDSKLAEYQGPSLMIFNDARFSKTDFKNLCELGGKSKQNCKTKIGKFGLGFNVVYNITDVPMVVSDDKFCILDPQFKCLDGGRAINLHSQVNNTSVVDSIVDQLSPFECIQDFDPSIFRRKDSFLGTIFRLPLRSEAQAETSEISKIVYSSQEITRLFDMIHKMGEYLILFTRNVREIRVSKLEKDDSTLKHLLSFTRKISNIENLSSNATLLYPNLLSEATECTYEVNIIKPGKIQRKYIVSAYSQEQNNKQIKISCTAASVSNGVINATYSNSLFCFLPLPVDCALPYILNGNFEISSSRRDITMKTIDDKETKGDWNIDLIQNYSVIALFNLLNAVKAFLNDPEDVYKLFPVESDKVSQIVIEKFYRMLPSTDFELFHTFAGYQSFSHIKIIDNDIEFHMQKKVKSLFDALHQKGLVPYCMIIFPSDILKKIRCLLYNTFILSFSEYFRLIVENVQVLNYKDVEEIMFFSFTSHAILTDHILMQYSCIKTNHGFFKPSQVVHPYGRIAPLLYFTDDYFPYPESLLWNDSTYKGKWFSIGMITDNLNAGVINECWKNLFTIQDYSKAVNRAKQFFFELNRFCQHNDVDFFKVPVLKQNELQWVHPSECYANFYKNAIDLAFPIYDVVALDIKSCHSLMSKISLMKPPSISHLEHNISLLRKANDLEFHEKVNKFVLFIEYLINNGIFLDLKDNFCIPNSDFGFSSIKNLSLNRSDCSIGNILTVIYPLSHKNIENYLLHMGAMHQFSVDNYIDVINNYPTNEVNEPVCNQIITALQYLYIRYKNETSGIGFIRVPSRLGVLTASTNLCINDCPWLQSESFSNTCHEMIPPIVAHHFGVKTQRHFQLDAVSRSLGKPFGQSESLTNRLKRIASQYSDKKDLYKEMLQNADDSGASFLHIVLDKTTYNKERVIAEGWEMFSGPALLFYNNACFTESDLQGIQSLGEGSKQTDYNKIGKFGVGFNCVYQVTDTPQICTQLDNHGCGTLGVFDPLHNVVKSGSPGVLIDLSPKFIAEHIDSFECLHFEALPCLEGGTTFRLPFRKTRSNLSEIIPVTEDFEKDLITFSNTVSETMLFLKNIKCIKVSVIENSKWNEITIAKKNIETTRNSPSLSLYKASVKGHICNKEFTDKWIVSESEIFSTKFLRMMKGSVALCLSKKISPALYCYLPLKSRSGLFRGMSPPINFNGEFILNESRSDLFLDHHDSKSAWNLLILKDCIGHAYSKLFTDEVVLNTWNLSKGSIYSYFQKLFLFNDQEYDKYDVEFNICKGLFQYLQNMDKQFLPVLCNSQVSFYSLSNAVFASFACSNDKQLLRNLCKTLNIKIVGMPYSFKHFIKMCNGIDIKECNFEYLCREIQCQEKSNEIALENSVFRSKVVLLDFLHFSLHSNNLVKKQVIQMLKKLPIFLSKKEVLYDYEHRPLSSRCKLSAIFPELEKNCLDEEVEEVLSTSFNLNNLSVSEFCKYFEKYFPELSENSIVEVSEAEFMSKVDCLSLIWKYLISEPKYQEEDCLQSLCLVPAKNMVQHKFAFFSLSLSRNVVVQNFDILQGIHFEANLEQCKSVYKLHDLFKESNLNKHLISFTLNYTNICFEHILHFCAYLHNNGEFFSKPSCCYAIRKYLIRNYKEKYLSDYEKSILKTLPIHYSIEKKYLPFHPSTNYMHRPNLPENGIASNINLNIFHCQSFEKFYKILDESLFTQSHDHYYINVVFPNFIEKMKMDDVVIHLAFLEKFVKSQKNSSEKQELMSALANKSFIEISGKKYLPQEVVWVDEEQKNDIWAGKFLTPNHKFKKLKKFLLSLGVRTACTNDEILEYAKYLEAFCLKSEDESNCSDAFFKQLLRHANIDEKTIIALSYLKIIANKPFECNNKLCRFISVHDSIFYKPPEVDKDCIHDIVNLASRLDVNVICNDSHPLYELYSDSLITTKELVDLFLTKKQFTLAPIPIEESSFQSKKCLLSFIKVCACEASFVEELLSKKCPIHLSAAGMIFDDPQKLFGEYDTLSKLFPSLKHSIYEPEILEQIDSRKDFNISAFHNYFLEDFPNLSRGRPFLIPDDNHKYWISLIELMWEYITKHFSEEGIMENLTNLSLIPSTNTKKKLYLLPICISENCAVVGQNFLGIDAKKLSSVYFLFKNFKSKLLQHCSNTYFDKYCLHERSCGFENLIKFLDHLQKNNEFKVRHDTCIRISKEVISKSTDQQKISSSSREILLELPIHKNLASNLVTLRNKYFYLVYENLPKNGLELHLTGENNEMIGYSTEEERIFYRKLGGLEMEIEQLYVEMIVPIYFKSMTKSDIYVHLRFIRENFNEDKENLDRLSRRALFYALGHAPIIEVEDEMLSISDLFDPTIKLFKIFRSNVLMPNDVFENIEPPVEFLQKLGLRSFIDEKLFLQLCYEHEIQCALHCTSNHFDEFLKYANNNERKYTEDAFKKLQSIKILKAQNFERFGYVSIESSYPFELYNYLKYVAPIASKAITNEVRKLQFVSFLSDNANPIKILENIKISVSINDVATVKACMQYIINHSLDYGLIYSLTKFPCVLSENGIWVKPQHVSRFLNFNYAPYIYQISDNFVQFWSLIHKCGGTEQLTANQCILGLNLIKENNWFLKDPNDSIIAKKFLNIICMEHKHIDFSIVDGVSIVTKDRCLRSSSDCWICDDRLLNRYNILPDSDIVDLEFIDLTKFQIISAINTFPVALRPKFVSKEISIVPSIEMFEDYNAGEENQEIIDIVRNIQNSDILSCLDHVIRFYIFHSKKTELHETEICDKLSFVNDIHLYPVKYIYLKVESDSEALNNVNIPHDLHAIFKETNMKNSTTIFYYTKSCTRADLFVEFYEIISIPELNQAVFERLLQTSTTEERNDLLELYGINTDWTHSRDVLGAKVNEYCTSELGRVSKIDLGHYVIVKNQSEDSFQYAKLLDITEAGGHENVDSLKCLIEFENGSSTLVSEELIFSLHKQQEVVFDSINFNQRSFQSDSTIEHNVLNAYKNVLSTNPNRKLIASIKDKILNISNSELESNFLENVVIKMTDSEKENMCFSISESLTSFEDQFVNAVNHPIVIEYTNTRLAENRKIIEEFSENDSD